MTPKQIVETFKQAFDVVGIIETARYIREAKKRNFPLPKQNYPTMVVLALAYPKRQLSHSPSHLIPSFYTFGGDYHTIMKEKIKTICEALPYPYDYGVDNHPLNERLMASLAGIGFFGKNQLIINKDYGSYIFLAYVILDTHLKQPINPPVLDDCGDCRKCIEACPTNALTDEGYIIEKCISYYNQEKIVLSKDQIKNNYQLFGCDICQVVCPKNIQKGKKVHDAFKLSGKEAVSIQDLFTMNQKSFKAKYNDMAYLWKGKTLLMRNASTLMLNHRNTDYLDLIEASLKDYQMPWYQETTQYIVNALKRIKEID